MRNEKVNEDGSITVYTDKGDFWYWIPKEQVEILKEMQKKYDKEFAKIMWGKK